MDIREVLMEYDSMFAKNTPDEISGFLANHIQMAEREGDKVSLLTLLNEQIGFARDLGQKDIALEGCRRLKTLTDELGIRETVNYGKTMLNIANAYRAFGLYDESEELFGEIEKLYARILPEKSYDFAPLYNNWSIKALTTGDSRRACTLIRKAIDVIDRFDEAVIEQATSRVNLACAIMEKGSEGTFFYHSESASVPIEVSLLLDEAISKFESAGGNDFHFASALSAKGDYLMKVSSFDEAAIYYKRAIEIIKMHIEDNFKTETLKQKINAAEQRMAETKQ